MYHDPIPCCPHCGQLDQVRKVSAIYDAGTRWTEAPAELDGFAVSSSILATRLAPPTRPRPHTGFEAGWRGLLAFLRLAPLRILALLGLLLLFAFVHDPLRVVLVVGGLLLARALVARWEQRRVDARLPFWEAERLAWEERYYCGRCDDTFTPVQLGPQAHTGQTVRMR